MSDRMVEDWFYAQFVAPCPHGAVKNYCAACLLDEAAVKRELAARKRAERAEVSAKDRAIRSQSDVIASQAAEIKRLRQLRTESPKREGERTGRGRWRLGRRG